MPFTVCVIILLYNLRAIKTEDAFDNEVFQIQVADVADEFITLLENKQNMTERMRDLKDKLAKVDTYVVDRDKYLKRIKLEAKLNQLNATNFYEALLGKDAYQNWRNESKCLYLKLKEKMNRNDLLTILSDRGKKKLKKYARRMMHEGYRPSKQKEIALDEAVDKYLGEKAIDNHKFEEERYSKYWDPQGEILDRLSKVSGRRIYKGERSTVRYYPFVVSIHIMGRFWCGGAIYWVDLVITSASCLQLMHNNRFFRENPKALQVRVGSNHSRIGGEIVDALEVFFHPGYNPRTLRNNIAVIRLRRLLRFSYHRIPKMIEISTQSLGVPSTATVLLLGWGVTKTNQKLAFEPIFLQTKELPIYPNNFCKEVYGSKFVSETMFCAGTLTTGEGACDHDAGGPAVLSGKLVGIISYGPSICGYPDTPTVFTLVGAYTDWIETVNETIPGYYRGKKRTSTTMIDPYVEYFSEPPSTNTFEPPPMMATNKPPNNWKTHKPYKKKPTPQALSSIITTTSAPFTPAYIPEGPPPERPSPEGPPLEEPSLPPMKLERTSPQIKTTTEDLFFELPPGAVERSKDLQRNDAFKINPVIQTEDQAGMFVESRRHHKAGGKKRRDKNK